MSTEAELRALMPAPEKQWDGEQFTFGAFKSKMENRFTSRGCRDIALPPSNPHHRAKPVWLLGPEKSSVHFMFHPRSRQSRGAPAIQLTFGSASPIESSTPSALIGAPETPPSTPMTAAGATTPVPGTAPDPSTVPDVNDLDLSNPIMVNGVAVTEKEAELNLKIWMVKTDYKNKRAVFEYDKEQYEKDRTSFLTIVQLFLDPRAMKAISKEFNSRAPAVVWARILELGESDQSARVLDLYRRRQSINLKGSVTVTQMEALFLETDVLLEAAGENAPSPALTVSALVHEFGKYQAFDLIIGILRGADCIDIVRWWRELKKVESDFQNKGGVLATQKKPAAGKAGGARAHNARAEEAVDYSEEGGATPARPWKGLTKALACRICDDDSHKAENCTSSNAVTCPSCKWTLHKDAIECLNFKCPSNVSRRSSKKMKARSQAKLATWDGGLRPPRSEGAQDKTDEIMNRMQEGFDRVNLALKKNISKWKKVNSHVKKVDRQLNGSDEDEDSDDSR